jgi:class 3 adenylate cyclase
MNSAPSRKRLLICGVAALAAATLFLLSLPLPTVWGAAINVGGAVVFLAFVVRQPHYREHGLAAWIIAAWLSACSTSGLNVAAQWGEGRFIRVVTDNVDWPFHAVVVVLVVALLIADTARKGRTPGEQNLSDTHSVIEDNPRSLVNQEISPMSDVPVRKSIVVIDLSRYSDIAKHLEQHSTAVAVAELNRQIQSLIRAALQNAGVPPQGVPYKSTGDGAIIALDQAEKASRMAEALHRQAEEHNRGRDVELAQRHFRVGVFTGEVILEPLTSSREFIEFHGLSVSNAVRLEGACRTGEVLICSQTWGDLSADDRNRYIPTTVKGKRTEAFHAYLRKVVEPAPWDHKEKETLDSQQAPAAGKASPLNTRNEVCSRLLDDWDKLANHFHIPDADRRRFKQGLEPDAIWVWLDQRGRLAELAGGLAAIGRQDLVEVLNRHP